MDNDRRDVEDAVNRVLNADPMEVPDPDELRDERHEARDMACANDWRDDAG